MTPPDRSISETDASAEAPSGADTWLELIDQVTRELADGDGTIECEFDDVEVDVPMRTGADPESATWRFDGNITISIGTVHVPLRAWLRYWNEKRT